MPLFPAVRSLPRVFAKEDTLTVWRCATARVYVKVHFHWHNTAHVLWHRVTFFNDQTNKKLKHIDPYRWYLFVRRRFWIKGTKRKINQDSWKNKLVGRSLSFLSVSLSFLSISFSFDDPPFLCRGCVFNTLRGKFFWRLDKRRSNLWCIFIFTRPTQRTIKSKSKQKQKLSPESCVKRQEREERYFLYLPNLFCFKKKKKKTTKKKAKGSKYLLENWLFVFLNCHHHDASF